ncbi:MAG: acyl-CoA dehydrogenase family protein, partial [Actinomycetes bacterium]
MSDSPTLEAFTAAVHAFLESHAERRPPASEFVWGEGSDDVAVFDEKDRDAELAEAAEAKRWRALRFDHGMGWITGPVEYGGAGLTGAYERAYAAAEAQYVTPPMGLFTISLGMVAPTILAHGTDEAKDAYLRDLYR